MHCDGRLVQRLLESSQVPFDVPIRLQDAGLTERMLSGIDRELRSHAQPDPLILESLLAIWIRELAREGSRETRIPQRLLNVRNFIDENSDRLVLLEELAGVAHLSVSQFSAEFRRCFGQSPIRYATQARLRHAIHYLLNPNYSIAEAAEKTGFADLFHFSKSFKKHFGASPRAYRKRLLSAK
jgi:AraC-like DNA-binding protein